MSIRNRRNTLLPGSCNQDWLDLFLSNPKSMTAQKSLQMGISLALARPFYRVHKSDRQDTFFSFFSTSQLIVHDFLSNYITSAAPWQYDSLPPLYESKKIYFVVHDHSVWVGTKHGGKNASWLDNGLLSSNRQSTCSVRFCLLCVWAAEPRCCWIKYWHRIHSIKFLLMQRLWVFLQRMIQIVPFSHQHGQTMFHDHSIFLECFSNEQVRLAFPKLLSLQDPIQKWREHYQQQNEQYLMFVLLGQNEPIEPSRWWKHQTPDLNHCKWKVHIFIFLKNGRSVMRDYPRQQC